MQQPELASTNLLWCMGLVCIYIWTHKLFGLIYGSLFMILVDHAHPKEVLTRTCISVCCRCSWANNINHSMLLTKTTMYTSNASMSNAFGHRASLTSASHAKGPSHQQECPLEAMLRPTSQRQECPLKPQVQVPSWKPSMAHQQKTWMPNKECPLGAKLAFEQALAQCQSAL